MTGPKSSRRLLAAVVLGLLLVPTCFAAAATVSHEPKSKTEIHKAKSKTKKHKPKCKPHYVAKRVRVRKRMHHRVVWVRKWKCVKAKSTHAPAQPTSTAPAPAPAPPAGGGTGTGGGSGTTPSPLTHDCAGTPGSATPNYANLDACGYPSPNTTGVPAGTQLTPSGSITISTAGAVVNGLAVSGSVNVRANNVTIENSDIAYASSSNAAVVIASGVTGTLLEHDSIHGTDNASGSLQAAVTDMPGTVNSVTEDHVYAYNVDRILEGPGTVSNSFNLGNANISGEHYEAVYEGNGSVTLNHDTLLNPHNQTAAIFLSTDFGPLGTVQITDNLLAGGDYVLYGDATNVANRGITSETVTGNRFSRLYFPDGALYGPATYMPSSYTWSGNIWDDTGQPVTP
jgi:hypothetical protein